MFEKAAAVPVQDEAPKVIAEAQKIVAAKEEAEEKVVSIKEASQAAVVAPAKVDTVKIVKGEKVKVPNKDWSINEKTEAAAKLQQAPAAVPVPAATEKTVSAKTAPAGTWQVQLMSSQNKKQPKTPGTHWLKSIRRCRGSRMKSKLRTLTSTVFSTV